MRQQKVFHSMIFFMLIALSVGCSPLLIRPDFGRVVQQDWSVDSFEAVNLCCGMHLELTQSEQTMVKIEGDEAILNELEVLVRNDKLTIQFRSRFNLVPRLNNRQVTIYITTPNLHALELSGGSQGKIGILQTTDLQLSLSGGSQLAIVELDATTLTSDLSGGSRLSVEAGNVDGQIADASGGSRYLLEKVQSERAELDFSGGARARIRVSTMLRVDASGGSDVAYHGSPALEQHISGGSRVRSLGE